MEDKLLLGVKECSKFTGIGEDTLRTLAKKYEDIPAVKVGNKTLFIKSKLEEWFIEHMGESLDNEK